MPNLDILTSKERQVLLYLLQGKPFKQAGQEMYISTNTFKKHVKNIYRKINVRNRTEALLWLLRQLYPEILTIERIQHTMEMMLMRKVA